MILKGDLLSSALALTLSATLCGCVAAADGEAPEGDDTESTARPIVNGTTATAYPESVLLDMKEGGVVTSLCSGSLIAPRVVLTAGHCVYGFDGWNVTAPFAGTQKATAKSAATYDWHNDSEYVDPNMHDIGLVFLDKDIVLASYPKIATTAVAAGTKVVNVGRIRNGVASYTKLYASTPVGVKGAASYGFPFDYVATEIIESGDSGGPDFLVGSAPHTIVAVNSGAGGGTEVLARVDLVSSWIASQIAAHPGGSTPGGGSPPASCSHGLCTQGGTLKTGCDPCVTTICAADSYCCQTAWDAQCVSEVQSMCGQSTCH